MKLKPVNLSDLSVGKSGSKYRDIVREFADSELEAAEVEGEFASTNSAVTQLRRYIRELNAPVAARIAEGKVYLVRK